MKLVLWAKSDAIYESMNQQWDKISKNI